MKIFKLIAVALVAMLGFTACDNDPEHICDDHSADLVGTWTCLTEGFAEALVIKADGSLVSTGVAEGHYWENIAGKIVVEDGDVTLTFEDGDNFKGHFDIIPGKAFSVYNEEDGRFVFNYCEKDLSDEIVGMWVCHEGLPGVENDMAIFTYSEDGKMTMTTQASEFIPADFVNVVCDYKVVGDIMFTNIPKDNAAEGNAFCQPIRLTYTPNGTTLGDIYTQTLYAPTENGTVYLTSTWLRIKQNLDLEGKAYDYNNTYVSNVKGLDEDMTMMGYTFNIGKMEGKNLDKMLKTLLFAVEFPNANTLKYQYHYNGQNIAFEARIVVDGNKVTIKMSEMYPYYRDVDMYMFQDQDNTQLHMYMPTSSFINYFGNMDVAALAFAGEIDVTDAAAVQAIFDRMDERVESINVSFTFKASK